MLTRGETIHRKHGAPRCGRFGSIHDTVFLHFRFGSVHPVFFSATSAYKKKLKKKEEKKREKLDLPLLVNRKITVLFVS